MGNNFIISDKCKIQDNISVYDNVTLEEGVFCGPSMVFKSIHNPCSLIERNKIEYRVTNLSKIEATLGANCTLVCGTSVGEYFLGAGAIIYKDVKPYVEVGALFSFRLDG